MRICLPKKFGVEEKMPGDVAQVYVNTESLLSEGHLVLFYSCAISHTSECVFEQSP